METPQQPKFYTRKELAERLGVTMSTLNVKIWAAHPHITPSFVELVDGQWVHKYDAATVTRILALFAARKGTPDA